MSNPSKKDNKPGYDPRYELPKFEIPNFEFPRMEVPAAFRDLAEKGIAQTKENYDRLKQVAEETTDAFETAYSAYTKGALELTGKLLDNTQAHINAIFAFTKSVMESKTVAEIVEKQTSFTSSQFATLSTQGQDIHKSLTAIANDVSEPIKSVVQGAAAEFKRSA